MKFRQSWMLFSSILILSFPMYKLVQACSDGPDPYDYYPQFFPPDVTQQPAFNPFHYTAQLKYYDDWENKPVVIHNDANIEAWQAFTNHMVPAADLDSFIYRYPLTELSNLYYHLEKQQALNLNPATTANGFTHWFENSKDLESLGYLMFAKKCEAYAVSEDWAAPTLDSIGMGRLVKNGLQLNKACKQDFIRERYAYQVLRMSFYAHQYTQTLQLYSQLIRDNPGQIGPIYARCLGIRAGCLFRLDRKPEAAYLFSRVFDLSDPDKRSSFISFDWASTQDLNPVLAYCKSAHEKSVVYLMDGLHNYDQALPQIQAAYQLDPAVRGLDVLFTREINKVEERYAQTELLQKRNLQSAEWYFNRYEGDYRSNDSGVRKTFETWKNYCSQLNAFAKRVATSPNNKQGPYWSLASAYLYFIEGNMPETKRLLDMTATAKLSARQKDLHDVINTLWIIRSSNGMNTETEAALLPSMQWLDKQAANDPGFNKTYRDLMGTVLCTAYLQSGDTIKAIYCLARTERDDKGGFRVDEDFMDLPGSLLEHMSVEKLRQVQAFVNKSAKSPWEKWLLNKNPYPGPVLAELEGTKYLREHRFAEGITAFGKLDASQTNKTNLPDPFIAHIQDVMDLDSLDTLRTFTKLEFCKQMLDLSKKTDAKSLFEYGTGLYNMTYYGKAHHAYDYYRSSTDGLAYYSAPEQKALPEYVKDYYGAYSAESYFIKAAQASADPELRAKSLWMAAKCWQKRCPTFKSNYWDRDGDTAYYLNAIKNPYFLQVTGPLNTTAFMKEALNSCGYLRDYARKH